MTGSHSSATIPAMPHPRRARTSPLLTAARAGARLAGAATLVATLVATAPPPAGATAPDSVFVAVGGLADGNPACDTGRSATSLDSAATWPTTATAFTPISQPPAPCIDGGELYDIARSGSTWLAVGTKTLASGATQGVVFRSTNDGASWTQVGSIPPTPPGVIALEAIATNETGRWVAGGYHGLYYSDDDGATWSPAWGSALPTAYQVHDIAERPGTANAWAVAGSIDPAPPVLRRAFVRLSTNGSWWATGWGYSGSVETEMNGVAISSNGTTVAVGATHALSDPPGRYGPLTIMQSSSGSFGNIDVANWFNTARGGLNDVAVDAGGRWIAVGTKDLGSPDAVAYRVTNPAPGSTWSDVSAGLPAGTSDLQAVTTDRLGTWVAAGGDAGSTSRSVDDGLTWSPEHLTIPAPAGRGRMRGIAVRPGTTDPWTT